MFIDEHWREVPSPLVGSSQPLTTGAYARAVVKARARIGRYFEASLFNDPCFDILLDLYASEAEGVRVCVSDSVGVSRIAQTSAYRCLDELEQRGLIARQPHPRDKRKVLLVLTDSARETLTQYIEEIAGIPLGDPHRSSGINAGANPSS